MPRGTAGSDRTERARARAEYIARGGDGEAWDEWNARREAAERAGEDRAAEQAASGGSADSVLADIPVVGWISGASAREDERRAAEEAERNRAMWGALEAGAPTIDDLTPDYTHERTRDEYGDLLMGDSRLEGMDQAEQRNALGQIGASQRALAELMRGGMTAADRQALTAQRLQEGQQLRGANLAAIQQMGARGMGGGGAELAARLGGSQAYANANAMGDAAILGGAQQRALQAMQAYGQLGSAYGGIAGQMNAQELARRQAIDAYNQANYGWRRGRAERNTAWANRGADARSAAHQQGFENRLRTTAGKAGHNPVAGGAADRAREDESSQAAVSGIAGLLEGILG